MVALTEKDIFKLALSNNVKVLGDLCTAIEKAYSVQLSSTDRSVLKNTLRLYQYKYKQLQNKRIEIDEESLTACCKDDAVLDFEKADNSDCRGCP